MKMLVTLEDGDLLTFYAEEKHGSNTRKVMIDYCQHRNALDIEVVDEDYNIIDKAVVSLEFSH